MATCKHCRNEIPPGRTTLYCTDRCAVEPHVTKGDGCWVWNGANNGVGYGQVNIMKRRRYAHRIMYEDAFGPIPKGLFVLHRCDNRACCKPTHLFLGTAKDNTHDMLAKGRSTRTLSDEQIRAIRLLKGKMTQVAVGRAFGVKHSTVSNVWLGKTWGHLE